MNTIKNIALFQLIYLPVFLSGQVGINTVIPSTTLEIKGKPQDPNVADGLIAPEITGLQLKNKDNKYTAAQNGSIVYVTEPLTSSTTTPKTIYVLKTGYYNFDSSKGTDGQWIKMFHDPIQVISGADGTSAYTGPGITLISNSTAERATLVSRTFTLNEKSLVHFTISVPVSNLLAANGSSITSNAANAFGFNLLLTGGNYNNQIFTRQVIPFTTSGNYIFGVYQIGSSRSVILEPGTYTADISVMIHSLSSQGFRATFGAETDTVFDILTESQ